MRSERRLDRRGTFALWQELSEALRRHEALAPRPFGIWFRSLRLRRAGRIIGSLVGELNDRYDAVIRTMLRLGIEGQQSYTAGQVASRYAGLWLPVQDEAKARLAASALPGTLWESAVVASGAGEARLAPLKTRFMLRPFVDAMPPSDERGMLRLLAFGRTESPVTDSLEIQRTLASGCRLLHESILERLPDLEPWTDGALTERAVLELEPPYREYLQWLFPG